MDFKGEQIRVPRRIVAAGATLSMMLGAPATHDAVAQTAQPTPAGKAASLGVNPNSAFGAILGLQDLDFARHTAKDGPEYAMANYQSASADSIVKTMASSISESGNTILSNIAVSPSKGKSVKVKISQTEPSLSISVGGYKEQNGSSSNTRVTMPSDCVAMRSISVYLAKANGVSKTWGSAKRFTRLGPVTKLKDKNNCATPSQVVKPEANMSAGNRVTDVVNARSRTVVKNNKRSPIYLVIDKGCVRQPVNLLGTELPKPNIFTKGACSERLITGYRLSVGKGAASYGVGGSYAPGSVLISKK